MCLGDYHHPFPFGIQKCRLLVNLNEFNLNVWGKLFGKCWILLRSGDMTSFQPNVSPNCPLHCPSNLGMSLLCFFPSYYNAFKEFSRNVPIMLKKVPIMPVCHGKKVYHWRWWAARLGAILHTSRVWQSSVQCRLPHGSCAPARRVSRDLTLSHKVRRPRQACWIMKRLECRVLGRAPGNPLAHFWSCQQYYY